MSKKLFLTSFIAIGFVANVYAEPSHTGEFPQDGLMQEDYTYTNAATETNMDGVYEGSVNATAEYENISYQLAAGQYLPANSETPTTCDQNGYFCAGDQNGVNYQSYAQGLTQCPNGYANSGTGASANTDCFRSCVTGANGDVPHSSGALTGGVYYDGTSGDGVNACEPSACEHGWHVQAAAPDLMTVIGVSEEASDTGYVSHDGENVYNDTTYGLSITNDRGKFVVDYGNKGIIRGTAQCSKRSVTTPWHETNGYQFANDHFVSELIDETGQNDARYCYCHLDSYTPVNDSAINLSGPWVFVFDYINEDAIYCMNNCAVNCADFLFDGMVGLPFRTAMFGAYPSGSAQCSANTITINWSDVDPLYAGQNNEGTATYGGNINTPFKAATKPGKRFTGWRFSVPPIQETIEIQP